MYRVRYRVGIDGHSTFWTFHDDIDSAYKRLAELKAILWGDDLDRLCLLLEIPIQ